MTRNFIWIRSKGLTVGRVGIENRRWPGWTLGAASGSRPRVRAHDMSQGPVFVMFSVVCFSFDWRWSGWLATDCWHYSRWIVAISLGTQYLRNPFWRFKARKGLRLWQIDWSTLSINTPMRVSSTYASTPFNEFATRTPAYYCGVMSAGCMYRRIITSTSLLPWSAANFFRKQFLTCWNHRK